MNSLCAKVTCMILANCLQSWALFSKNHRHSQCPDFPSSSTFPARTISHHPYHSVESLQSCLQLWCQLSACAVYLPHSELCPSMSPVPGRLWQSQLGELVLRVCVRGYGSALVWVLLKEVDAKHQTMGPSL